jgi:predicted nuclease of predicted toxin-antitoxin system
VRFLIDAQLPTRLATLLNEHGQEAIHTSSLPAGNRSTDQQICTIADAQDRVVVTKDADFRNSHLLSGSPRRLLILTTGNITNDALLELVGARLAAITHAFETSDFVELGPTALIVRRSRFD